MTRFRSNVLFQAASWPTSGTWRKNDQRENQWQSKDLLNVATVIMQTKSLPWLGLQYTITQQHSGGARPTVAYCTSWFLWWSVPLMCLTQCQARASWRPPLSVARVPTTVLCGDILGGKSVYDFAAYSRGGDGEVWKWYSLLRLWIN